ncbi:S-layer homology domain-containing protein [Paenibacillus andongensis]|uniref:S-layer homology domain-containing protein n=1 Tax=Paenibacillus andongensis TaxID=2975482 RepID=UPI0021BAE2CF|nr:S-layer homology domain-containing protein [Paenibacillus andongensis]
MLARLLGKIVFIVMFLTVQIVSFSGLAQAENQPALRDINGYWAEDAINEWIGNGLISGYADQTFQPDKVITRAEFILLVNKAFGYLHKDDQTFKDVSLEKWFYNDVAKAKYAGYISGFDDGSFRPDQPISREQAAKIIYQLIQLKDVLPKSDTRTFLDEQQMSDWSKPYIKAVASEGYLKGYPDQSFRPQKSITRAEAVVMLDNAVGHLIHKPGTYTPKADVEGNMTVNSGGVTIKNAVIKGDLILAAGIGEGEVFLDHVTVKGRTIVNGGGENSIEIQDSTLNQMVVQKDFGRVRVFTKGSTIISDTIIKSGAKLEQEQGNEGFQSVSVQGTTVNDVVQLVGTFVKVDLKSTVTVEVSSQSVVTLLETQAGSEGSGIKMLGNAILEQIILQSAAKVTGEGSILNAVIKVEGVSFEQIVKKYTLGDLVKLVVIGGKEVTGNSPVTTPGSTNISPVPNEDSPGGGVPPGKPTGGEPDTEPGNVEDINAAFIIQNKVYTLYPAMADYSTVQWDVSNTVTQDTYQTEYSGTVEDVGIYSIIGGSVSPAPYDVTKRNSTKHYSGVLLSSITVNESVYAQVYYVGNEMISYQINGSYAVHDLGNQLTEQAVPLAAGDRITLVYGSQYLVFATWNGSDWELDGIYDQLESPTGLKASTVSNREIALQWNPVANADQYHIYYSATATGKFVPLEDQNGKPITVTGTTYVDSTNLPHTTRYYVVTSAMDRIGVESRPSSIAFATTYYNAHIALDFEITNTLKHPSEPILYITDKTNKKLYRVNYETGDKTSIAFDLAPESLTYADGKIYVSLLKAEHSSYTYIAQQQGAIAVVNAATLTLEGTHNIAIDPFDVAVVSGYLYVSSGSGQWTKIKSYDLKTFAEVGSSDIRQQSYIQTHPLGNKLYTITTDTSPRDLGAYNVTNGQYVEPGGYDSPYHGDYAMSTNFTISPDGAYIFNGSGNVFMATSNKYDDMKFVYGLGQAYDGITFDLSKNIFYTAKNNAIQVYDYTNFNKSGLYHLDGTAKNVFNGTNRLISVSTLDGKNIVEIVEKNSIEAIAPIAVPGVQLDGRVVDIAYDSANKKAYAIDEAFRNLYVVDLQSQTIVKTVKLPYRPAGLTISEDGSSLFIVNDDLNNLITEVRITDLQILRHLTYTSTVDSGDIAHRHIYHKNGILYVVMGDWEPTLLAFNSTSFAAVNYGTVIKGVGDLAFSSKKSTFFTWYQSGWNAGNAGSNVLAYSVSGNSVTKSGESSLSYPNFLRDPLDTPVLLLENQGKLVVKNKVLDLNNVAQVISTLPEPIYAASANGELLVGKNGIYSAATYQKVDSLALGTATEIFFDQNRMLYYYVNGALLSIQK